MNKRTKIGLFALALLLKISLAGFAQSPISISAVQDAAADVSSTMARSLPLNASLGLNWSDAHIGRFFPSIPPSFGIGASFGMTSIDLSPINDLASLFGFDAVPSWNRMPFPGYTVEGRIGGFFLPFDVGFKIGYLPPVGGNSFNLHYFLVGADIRYAVLDVPILPTISVGIGFNHLRGGIGGNIGTPLEITHNGGSITINPTEVNLNWSTRSLDFRVQASRSFFIITPYLGIGASYAWSTAGYEVSANITGDLAGINLVDHVDATDTGISSSISNNAFGLRLFGGLSINMAVVRLDFTGLYSLLDNNFGASIGFRFQL